MTRRRCGGWCSIAELRGHGLGRRLIGELLDKARAVRLHAVWLETFSELESAAHLYRSFGFEVVSEDTGPRWGRDQITFQRYELELEPSSGDVVGRSPARTRTEEASSPSLPQPSR